MDGGRGQEGAHGHAAIGRVRMELPAAPAGQEAPGVPPGAVVARFRQFLDHLLEAYAVRLALEAAGNPDRRIRLPSSMSASRPMAARNSNCPRADRSASRRVSIEAIQFLDRRRFKSVPPAQGGQQRVAGQWNDARCVSVISEEYAIPRPPGTGSSVMVHRAVAVPVHGSPDPP